MSSMASDFRRAPCFYWTSVACAVAVVAGVVQGLRGAGLFAVLAHILCYGSMMLAAGLFVAGLLALARAEDVGRRTDAAIPDLRRSGHRQM